MLTASTSTTTSKCGGRHLRHFAMGLLHPNQKLTKVCDFTDRIGSRGRDTGKSLCQNTCLEALKSLSQIHEEFFQVQRLVADVRDTMNDLRRKDARCVQSSE